MQATIAPYQIKWFLSREGETENYYYGISCKLKSKVSQSETNFAAFSVLTSKVMVEEPFPQIVF